MDGKARHVSEPPAVARDACLVESISLAKLPFQIAFLTQDHTIMEDDKCWHHQDYDPIGFLACAKRSEVISAVVGLFGLILVPASWKDRRAAIGKDTPIANTITPTEMRGNTGQGSEKSERDNQIEDNARSDRR
jgi:hypothetical protein